MKIKFLQMRLFLFTLCILSAGYSHAQVLTSCNDPEGGIQIVFDYSLHCPSSPGSLAGQQEIGYHSGANGWASVVEWDKPNAVHGKNNGSDVFVVYLPDVDAYYGVPTTAINFVFNQGPGNPAEPWGAEGKEDNGAGGCNDFYLPLANVTETCALSAGIHELLTGKDLTISPNPVTDFAIIRFENDAQEAYAIQIRNAVGQLVKEVKQFNGNQLEFNKNDNPAGFYMVTVTNAKGQFFSGQMMIQ
jgi:hypothetical protein